MRWRGLFSYLFARHHCHAAENVDDLFAAHLASQASAGRAAEGMRQASDDLRGRVEAARVQIHHRVAASSSSRPSPPTSEARAQIEALMKRMAERDPT